MDVSPKAVVEINFKSSTRALTFRPEHDNNSWADANRRISKRWTILFSSIGLGVDDMVWFNSCLVDVEVGRHVMMTWRSSRPDVTAAPKTRLLTQRNGDRPGRRGTGWCEQRRWKVAAMFRYCLDEQTEADQRRGDLLSNFTPCCCTKARLL